MSEQTGINLKPDGTIDFSDWTSDAIEPTADGGVSVNGQRLSAAAAFTLGVCLIEVAYGSLGGKVAHKIDIDKDLTFPPLKLQLPMDAEVAV